MVGKNLVSARTALEEGKQVQGLTNKIPIANDYWKIGALNQIIAIKTQLLCEDRFFRGKDRDVSELVNFSVNLEKLASSQRKNAETLANECAESIDCLVSVP